MTTPERIAEIIAEDDALIGGSKTALIELVNVAYRNLTAGGQGSVAIMGDEDNVTLQINRGDKFSI